METCLCNAPCAVIPKLINTAKSPAVINAICAQLAIKLSRKILIAYIIAVSPDQIWQVLQAHSEGSSLRGISRTTELAYNRVVSSVRAASQKAQLFHNAEVQAVQTEEVSADEMEAFVAKNRNSVVSKI